MGLGSTAYPKFCAFAYYLDHTLTSLGGKPLMPIETCDEMNQPEKSLANWIHDLRVNKLITEEESKQKIDVSDNVEKRRRSTRVMDAPDDFFRGKITSL